MCRALRFSCDGRIYCLCDGDSCPVEHHRYAFACHRAETARREAHVGRQGCRFPCQEPWFLLCTCRRGTYEVSRADFGAVAADCRGFGHQYVPDHRLDRVGSSDCKTDGRSSPSSPPQCRGRRRESGLSFKNKYRKVIIVLFPLVSISTDYGFS